MLAALIAATMLCSAGPAEPQTDGEAWNEGVDFYRAGDATNALRVLRPLMLSRTHGARAAEVVAKLEYDRGDLEEAAGAAQIALRAAPDDPRANRNFTRAVDALPRLRAAKRVERLLKEAQGRDPGGMLRAAAMDARETMARCAANATNAPERAVAETDALSKRAEALADVWIPVRETVASSVTNEEQAATIVAQIEQAEAAAKKAAVELGDLSPEAYATLSSVEHDFTRFFKLAALPPDAIAEDETAQTNAWIDAETVNGRPWQNEALDFTRAFRAKFPAWARAREQQAQSDTNMAPFTAEDQAKISALATELEKLQLGCAEKPVPPDQEKALDLIRQIRELMPKDGGGQGNSSQQQNQQQNNQQQNQDKNKDQNQDKKQDQDPQQDRDDQKDDGSQDKEEPKQDEGDKRDEEVEAVLKKAQERNDEHEAQKKARMRKAPLPPNERDW